MPKRDEAYMLSQRQAIVAAAHEVMLEKGLRNTSLRDICKAAGVSTGALYVHFETLADVFMATCVMGWDAPDAEEWQKFERIRTWDDYLAYMHEDVMRLADPQFLSHYRLVLEFVAELTQRQASAEAMSSFFVRYRQVTLKKLADLADSGAITLPLGLETTSDIHEQLLHGAYYYAIVDQGMPLTRIADSMVKALALTAGGPMPAAKS